MVTIYQAVIPDHETLVHDIFREYLEWASFEIKREYNISLDPQTYLAHDMDTLEIFMQPQGHLLLANVEGEVAGMACMRTIGAQTAEIKRMYVRPANRRLGIGRMLVDELVRLARASGNTILRLDSAKFMTGAHSLYRSFGFSEIAPYPQSEIPPEFRIHWVFMELPLTEGPAIPKD